MALAYWGHSLDESTLAKLLDTKPFGTAVRNVQRVSELGFSASFISTTRGLILLLKSVALMIFSRRGQSSIISPPPLPNKPSGSLRSSR
jgi:hypothetical protein